MYMNQLLTTENYQSRIKAFVEEFNITSIDLENYFKQVSSGLAMEMTCEEMSKYCSEVAASMITLHPNYNKLASVILIKYLHCSTHENFSERFLLLHSELNIFDEDIVQLVKLHRKYYDDIIDSTNDYLFDYFGLITLFKTYLNKINNSIVERPQDIYMKVAIQLHRSNFDDVKTTYELLSNFYYTHGTPTLYNSCLKKPQMASCFLLAMKDDSVEGIFETIKDCASIRKFNGGIGMYLTNIRPNKSKINSTGGEAKGIIPVIRLISETIKYFNKNETKRSTSCAFYLEPWHLDIFDFLNLRKNTGPEDMRARDAFIGLFINDIFMERVQNNENWSLFDPSIATGLVNAWGDEFNKLYEYYEKTIPKITIPAQKLWKEIICAQIETGTPYLVYKDSCNRNSNQNNLGTIKSSNLCAEIIEYSDANITGVCNLASICLPKFINNANQFDFKQLYQVMKKVTINLNKLIDISFYPTKEAKYSNEATRPIGIGVQGLADALCKMRIPFESSQAKELNRMIFETMYYSVMETSMELAKIYGPYPLITNSMYSKGIFHFEKYLKNKNIDILSGLWDWEDLREKIRLYGVRNSLTLSIMPTATTAQICGNSECVEPITSNIYTRRTFVGEFQIVNKYLMNDLIKLGLWSNEMKQLIIEYNGSIQNIPTIPSNIKNLYKTVWEIKMKCILDMAHERQAFVDQSQSLNLFISQPTYAILSSMHFYGWKLGLKTGIYYLRTSPIASAIKFTIDKELIIRTLSSMKNDECEPPNCKECSC